MRCMQRLLVYSVAPFGDFRIFDWQHRGALLFAVSYPSPRPPPRSRGGGVGVELGLERNKDY